MTRYRIDPEASHVAITATSTLHGIHGRADGVTGEITVGDDGALLDAHVEVEAERLRWGNPLLDRETRRRIDVRSHPTIRGDVTSVDVGPDGTLHLEGSIAFLGHERAVRGDVVVVRDADRLVVDGTQTFDVREWGLAPPNLLLIKVEPEITVTIHVEAPFLRQ